MGQRGPTVRSSMGRPQPNQALELTAPSAGFVALRGVVAWGPQLTAGVRLPWKDEGRHEADARRRSCGIAPLGAS
jgi:hypothetical protein